jgi:hypothetical protein
LTAVLFAAFAASRGRRCTSTGGWNAYVEVDDGSGYHPIACAITNAVEGDGIDGLQ